jgi:hypothetical protein
MFNNPPRLPGQQIPPLELPGDLQLEYANLVRIAHTPSELVFDFAHLLPGSGPAQVSSRIIMSPLGAKLFCRALIENLSKYEAAFGEIRVPGDPTLADNLFRGHPPVPPAPTAPPVPPASPVSPAPPAPDASPDNPA